MSIVKRRDGIIVPYDVSKIERAIASALAATGEVPVSLISKKAKSLSGIVEVTLTEKYETETFKTSVEEIQDIVEETLMSSALPKTAKAYILYRKQHEKVRDARHTYMDVTKTIDEYVGTDKDWRVKENSTVTCTLGGLILSNSGAMTANYWLNDVYDEDIAEAHKNCDIHIHDLSMLSGYCAGWNLKQLISEGLGGVEGRISSVPAKHLSTLCNQMVNFLGILQNEWAGAQAFSSFDTYLAPFVKADNLSYNATKQCIQSFIYGINTPSRWGTQPPFVNVTIDWTCPADLAGLPAIVGGKEMPFTYGDCQKEMDMINKAFIEIMIEGDANGRGFQYPIPTYSITKDFDWSETENNKLLFEMAAKYGIPYFSNYINSDMEPSDVRSMAILGNQEVIYRDRDGRIKKDTIGWLVKHWKDRLDHNCQMLMNGKFVEVTDVFEVPYESYETYTSIELKNGMSQRFSYDHRTPIVRDGKRMEVFSQDVMPGDKLLIGRHGYDNPSKGSYESGKIIGYYLARGWRLNTGTAIGFDTSDSSKNVEVIGDIERFFSNMGCNVTVDENLTSVSVEGRAAIGFVSEYVNGKRGSRKRLKAPVWDTSFIFRCGIYDGCLAVGGVCGNGGSFAHVTSKRLCDDLVALGMSIGNYFSLTETAVHSGSPSKIASTFYDLDVAYWSDIGASCYKTYNDDYFLVEVKSVKQADASGIDKVYNFTVNTDEHLYELPNGIITHQCCRLRLDLRELRKKSGGFFGAGESTGSIGVVTLNMPRLAYQSETEAEFYERLDKLMDLAARSLDTKRHVIEQLMETGLYPYTKRYLGSFDNHFSTIGLVGMNEAALNAKWLRTSLASEAGQKFAKAVLQHMRERLSDYQEQYGALFNLEATPAESTTYRFAKHDVEDFPDIITAANKGCAPFYTNSSHLPVNFTEDVFEALDIQDELQCLYTSGTVFHAFLGERLSDWKAAATLVRKIAENYKLPYYTLSPTYSVCAEHGYIAGEHETCPKCGRETEIYSRITGYYRPVKNWNDGKTQEFAQRKEYKSVVSMEIVSYDKLPHDGSGDECASCRMPELDGDSTCSEPNTQRVEMTSIVLLGTKSCPKCRAAADRLTKAGVDFVRLDAEDNPEIVSRYHITAAPVLLIPDDKSKTVGIIKDLASIYAFAKDYQYQKNC